MKIMPHLIEKQVNCKSSSSLKRQVTFSPKFVLTVYREDKSGVRQAVLTVLGKVTF